MQHRSDLDEGGDWLIWARNTPRNVLEDACSAIPFLEYDPEDPRASLNKIIDFHVMVALDPQVSKEARELYEKGRTDMLRDLLDGKVDGTEPEKST
jgi:hypothetical protein